MQPPIQYTLSYIHINRFCSSKMIESIYQLSFEDDRFGYLCLDTPIQTHHKIEIHSFLRTSLGIQSFTQLNPYCIQFPYIKIESDYYNIIKDMVLQDSTEGMRSFSMSILPPYLENPYLKMYHGAEYIHINTLQDSHFLLTTVLPPSSQQTQTTNETSSSSFFCGLCTCRTARAILRIHDQTNEKDALQLCILCLRQIINSSMIT